MPNINDTPSPVDMDPETVHKLLTMEAQGQIPDTIKPHIEKARSMGLIPPPLLGAANANGFSTKPEAVPQPQQSTFDSILGSIPSWQSVRSTAASGAAKVKQMGDSTVEGLLNPEAAGATVAGMMAGGQSTPIGMGAAGLGSAAVTAAQEAYHAAHEGRAMRVAPIAESFVSGAAGEGVGRAVGGAFVRRPTTPQGEAVQGFFGRENTMAHQLTDSAPLNFMANVAKYGPGGQSTIKDFEENQSGAVLDHLKDVSHFMLDNPPGPNSASGRTISIDPGTGEFDAGMAGKRYQRDVRGQIKDARTGSGYPEFSSKYGRSQETIPPPFEGATESKGPTVDALHGQRSDALKNSRRAFAARDFSGQSAHLDEASKLEGGINRALPDDAARNEYREIADRYKGEMERLDNPAVQNLRMDTTSNDVVDKVLDSKIKNYAPISEGVGQTNDELLGRVQKAASPEAWQQLQADTVHRLGERSINPETGMVDAKKMKTMLDGIDQPTKQRLFGKGLSDLQSTLSVVEQAQKYTKSQAGRLFIAIRTGQAGIGAASGAVGLLSGHPEAGLIGAASVLISPYAFAKLLTSETGRTLLTRAAKGGSDTVVQQSKRAITRWVAQNVTEEGRELYDKSAAEPANPTNNPPIPEPPQ